MNILHVMSQFEVTGPELYVASLAEQQSRMGHKVFVISDTITIPMSAQYFSMSIGNRSYFNRVKNIVKLRRFIKQHNIQCLHAHSRAASWVAYFASKLSGIAYISTIHGKQGIHFSSKTFNVYGKNVIAICENVKRHLINDLKMPESTIQLIRNCFSSQKWFPENCHTPAQQMESNENKKIVFVGRYSGPKEK